MILLIAVIVGFIAGLLRAFIYHHSFTVPSLRHYWLLLVAFSPQFLAFYLPFVRRLGSNLVTAVALASSQALLILFGWKNRMYSGFWLLTGGLLCNFLVIVSNGGLMPVSPATLYRLLPKRSINKWSIGERIGNTKNRLLQEEETRFAMLSDRLTVPRWTGYAIAYSIGDIFIALGAFWFLWQAGGKRTLDGK